MSRLYPYNPPLALVPLLRPLGAGFDFLTALRRQTYQKGWSKAVKVAAPVISVGNLTLGGNRKTPLCAFLAQALAGRGFRPAIISRGYGRKVRFLDRAPLLVAKGAGPLVRPEVAGDEPYLLAKITPAIVAVAADRLKAAALALNQGADILILDDGFQRLSFARDVDVLALTGPRPFGDGLVFPAGPLRERLAAGSAADLVVASNDSPPNPWGRPQFTASLDLTALTINNSRETLPLSFARKVRLAAFCGLGNPQNFFASLKAWDLAPVASLAWPDHVRYGADHIKRLRRFYRFSQAEWLVTTAKDAVKLVGQNLPPLLVAETTLRLEKPGEFLDLILGALKRRGHGL